MDYKSIIRAAVYAAEKHKYQRRKGFNQVPYINHPLKVTELLLNCAEDDFVLLIGAVLHDVVEDSDATHEEIAELFGQEVADLVQEVTDNKELPYTTRKELQVKHAGELSVRAKKLKIADKICNIQDIVNYPLDWTSERRLSYLEWAEQVIEGCRGVCPVLEKIFDETLQEGLEKLQTDLS
jgi:GTP diphosphokinase / guanosine-3',5'-bis(diphosphate) 3'-diphosphatase